MTKIDIISGFLGAGKTTLIKKLISDVYQGEKLVLIENEFGEIGIDGGFLQDSGVQINEMNSGCICCSLVGDFSKALEQVMADYAPDRIIIEPSGVGKLSDVIGAVKKANLQDAVLTSFCTVADVSKCRVYMKNFGEFYNDQIENAGCIFLSHTIGASEKKVSESVALLREHNRDAVIVTTDWSILSGDAIRDAMAHRNTLEADIAHLAHVHSQEHHHDHDHDEHCECGHHHHHDHDEHCECGHHHDHDHDEHCECGHHHHHDHDEHYECGHHHHHDHDEHCECGHHHHHDHDEHCECGHHHDHDHHHADEVFTSWGKETIRKFTFEDIHEICSHFDDDAETYGMILRAKGIVEGTDGTWIHFDYVPGEVDVRHGAAGVIGRVCVIGSKMNEADIAALFDN